MQPIERKKRRVHAHGRWIALGAAAALLALCVGLWLLSARVEVEAPVPRQTSASGVMARYDTKDVSRLRLTLRSGETWEMTQAEDGTVVVDGDPSFQISERRKSSLLNAAAVVGWQDVLAEDASAYADREADFGLDVPRVIAEITWRDGTRATVRLGDRSAMDETGWSYMRIDGDPRLFAVDTGTVDALDTEKAQLHPVEQPVLHKARMSRVTLTGADGTVQARWELQGSIGGDAKDRWLLTAPVRYPAEGERMDSLLTNLENLHLGTYIGEATSENRTLYGFDAPRFHIEVRMEAGSMGTTGFSGVYNVSDWPESVFTLTVGGAKSEHVDYVLWGGSIYLTSHYSLNVFMSMEPMNSLTRFVIPVALGNLKELTVRTPEGEDRYEIIRTERVAENNDLVYDETGQLLWDVSCVRNGEATSYAAFEAAYNDLLMVTVSGALPKGWQTAEAPHTVYTLTRRDGVVHQVALVHYDALHDAVLLDGEGAFYLIRDGLSFQAVE